MPTDVIMPQMGESIFEGTLTKWLKKPGDKVNRDEPLFEISTDKVDAEIPSPASGVLVEIKVQAGQTVQVNTVVAVLGEAGSAVVASAPAVAAPAAAPAKAAPAPANAPPAKAPSAPAKGTPAPASMSSGDADGESKPAAAAYAAPSTPQPPVTPARPAASAPTTPTAAPAMSVAEGANAARNVRSSPLVRKIAKDNNINLQSVGGTGSAGRITKDDIQNFLTTHGAGAAAASATAPAASGQASTQAHAAPATQAAAHAPAPALPTPTPGEVVPMSKMRAIIAKRMVESKHTSAHVHTVFKVDMTRVVKVREKQKASFEQRNGVKLTYMPFVTRACLAGIKAMPIVNSSVEGEAIRYHKNVNVGIAVALDWGLIVPVVKQAEERSFLGLQRAINDVAERARAKKLQPDEVMGGTFTITNPGAFGPQFGLPIINQPQVAILGMGGMFKEPVVVTDKDGNDSIAIRSIIRLTLGYDHRIIDGADADRFMVAVRNYLENWSEEIG